MGVTITCNNQISSHISFLIFLVLFFIPIRHRKKKLCQREVRSHVREFDEFTGDIRIIVNDERHYFLSDIQ